jgi:hypothetical protein
VEAMSYLPAIRSILLCSLVTMAACVRGVETPAASATGSATLSWSAPTANADGSPLAGLAGYRIYYGVDPGRLDHRMEIPDRTATTATVNGLSPGKWYFAVTAVGDDGAESAYSKLGSKTIR